MDSVTPQLDELMKEICRVQAPLHCLEEQRKKVALKCRATPEAAELVASVPVELFMVGDLAFFSLVLGKEASCGDGCKVIEEHLFPSHPAFQDHGGVDDSRIAECGGALVASVPGRFLSTTVIG